VALAISVLAVPALAASIFKCTDDVGRTVLQQTPCFDGYALDVKSGGAASVQKTPGSSLPSSRASAAAGSANATAAEKAGGSAAAVPANGESAAATGSRQRR
jgi:hypothetical protein